MNNSTSYRIIFLLILWITTLSFGCNSNKQFPEADEDNGGLILPDGFSALVVADQIGHARHLVVSPSGDIYVALRELKSGKGIVALRDTNKDGKADITEYFGQYPGTGIDIYQDYLYFGTDTAILRYKMRPGELIPDTVPELVAGGFKLTYQHASKPFTFDNKNNLYVNVGAPSNACQDPDRVAGVAGQDPCPLLENFGGIWKFSATTLLQDQVKDGKRYATGIRNAVALDWNFHVQKLYIVQHGRDQLDQFWPELYDSKKNAELPAEEFFLVNEGSDFGWPYCYFDPILQKKVLAPEYGGDGTAIERCAQKEDPIIAFPAHFAPNDLIFYSLTQFPERYQHGAFIAFHGSWNRAPEEQKGFQVVFVPFSDAFPSGTWEIFADGFAGAGKIQSPGDAKHRPMGLALGKDGSLYVSDSVTGKIWRIFYNR